jgi:Arc/MetJ-type ribon-helix-helix transcriptional regulator
MGNRKVSVCVPRKYVREIDLLIERGLARSRSEFVRKALRRELSRALRQRRDPPGRQGLLCERCGRRVPSDLYYLLHRGGVCL